MTFTALGSCFRIQNLQLRLAHWFPTSSFQQDKKLSLAFWSFVWPKYLDNVHRSSWPQAWTISQTEAWAKKGWAPTELSGMPWQAFSHRANQFPMELAVVMSMADITHQSIHRPQNTYEDR